MFSPKFSKPKPKAAILVNPEESDSNSEGSKLSGDTMSYSLNNSESNTPATPEYKNENIYEPPNDNEYEPQYEPLGSPGFQPAWLETHYINGKPRLNRRPSPSKKTSPAFAINSPVAETEMGYTIVPRNKHNYTLKRTNGPIINTSANENYTERPTLEFNENNTSGGAKKNKNKKNKNKSKKNKNKKNKTKKNKNRNRK